MSIIWGLIAIFLLLVELMTVKIIYIWYSLSALISLIISMNSKNFTLQFLLFLILGFIMLVLFRDKAVEILKKKSIITDADKIIGKEAIVTKKIKENSYGEVKVMNKKWAAYSSKKADVGEKVKVLDVEGVRLKVGKK